MKKVMVVFGTRPEAIKMCPVVKALKKSASLQTVVCVTGQHREMLDSVMQAFSLQAQYDLNIMERQQTLSTITTKTILGMDRVIDQAKPDLILVHGDTSTTFAGALSAFYHKIPVGHVEAGLRTWDKYSPYPEEMNRTLVGDIAELHVAPTRANADNLRAEGIRGEIFITGNTAIDALKAASVHTCVIDVRPEDQLLILVTCVENDNLRRVVAARRVRDTESESDLRALVQKSRKK